MQTRSFGKHKRKYITDKDLDVKFGPDEKNNSAKFQLKIQLTQSSISGNKNWILSKNCKPNFTQKG